MAQKGLGLGYRELLHMLHYCLTLRLKMAQKPYIIWSLSPKASNYESSEP